MYPQIFSQPTTTPFAYTKDISSVPISLNGQPFQFANTLNALRNIQMSLPENIKQEIEQQNQKSPGKIQDFDDSIVYAQAYRSLGRTLSQAGDAVRLADKANSRKPRHTAHRRRRPEPPRLPLPLRPVIPSGLRKLDEYLTNENKDGNNALILLSQFKTKSSYITMRQLLQSHRVDPNQRNNDKDIALHYAIANEATGKAYLLLRFDADANAKGMYGQTPTMLATLINDVDIIFVLAGYGVDINLADNDGNTALHLAVMYNKQAAFYELIRYKPNLSLVNKNQETPLFLAIKYGFYDFTRELIKLGADINDFSVDGLKPLVFAIISKDLELLGILLEGKADINIFDLDGKNSLLTLAEEHNFPQGAELLVGFGARYTGPPVGVISADPANLDDSASTPIPDSIAEPVTFSSTKITDPAEATITTVGVMAITTPTTVGIAGNITSMPAGDTTSAINNATTVRRTGGALGLVAKPVSFPVSANADRAAPPVSSPLDNTTHAASHRSLNVTRSLSSSAARSVGIIGQTLRWLTDLVGITYASGVRKR